MGLGRVEACMVVVSITVCHLKMMFNWDTSSETDVDDSCKNVLLELFSIESLIVNLLVLGCVIQGFMESQSCPLLWPYHT